MYWWRRLQTSVPCTAICSTALGTAIVSGKYSPGQVLTLEGVSAEHGVSRSVAREAIRVLESMGMVASRRRVGITIQPAEQWNVFDPRLIRWRLESGDRAAQLVSLSELRRGFEPAAAALAARRADPHQCRIMAAAVSDMVVHGRSGDLEAYLIADKIFHHTLLEASGNEMFRALNGVVAEVLTGRTHHGMMPETPNPRPSSCTTRSRARSGCATRQPPSAPCARSSTRRRRPWQRSSLRPSARSCS